MEGSWRNDKHRAQWRMTLTVDPGEEGLLDCNG
jgi:hypothetical protein